VFQVLFNNEKIGIGIEKTRDEAQVAEKALQNLESEYISSTSCVHHASICA
jgi:RNA polymerase II C-terminal domain phosphatase-like 1/2